MKKLLRNWYMAIEPYLFCPLTPLLRSKVTRIGRSMIAQKFLAGSGIEIGAFASPTLVPCGAVARYVDRVPASHWRDLAQYEGYKLIDPDIIDDGALLNKIPDASVDFVMSFQMLEHVPNTVMALKNWIRVIKPEGKLIVSVPDKRFTFDHSRSNTLIDHFIRDYEEGSEWADPDHYRDVGRNTLSLPDNEIEKYVADAPPAIHFHVWDFGSFSQFLHVINDYLGNPVDILHLSRNQGEIVAVMQKNI